MYPIRQAHEFGGQCLHFSSVISSRPSEYSHSNKIRLVTHDYVGWWMCTSFSSLPGWLWMRGLSFTDTANNTHIWITSCWRPSSLPCFLNILTVNYNNFNSPCIIARQLYLIWSSSWWRRRIIFPQRHSFINILFSIFCKLVFLQAT